MKSGSWGRFDVWKRVRRTSDNLSHSQQNSDYRPLVVCNFNNFGFVNGAVQQGIASDQTINITESQRETILYELQELKDIVEADKSLDSDTRDNLKHELNMTENEVRAKKPKTERLKSYLTSAKNIAEGTAAAASLIPKIITILTALGG